MKIEPEEKARARGIASPDRAEALMLVFGKTATDRCSTAARASAAAGVTLRAVGVQGDSRPQVAFAVRAMVG
jgi:hypothetical protein